MAITPERTEIPLVVIVGPTASGKTSIAIELAERLNGEIICADSRTIYKGMDIGTAKPSSIERSRVPHWGLDLVSPDHSFNVSDFKRYADEKISEIRARGKIPFLVGGSGLYIDAVIFDYQFGDKADASKREYLESLSLEELHIYCKSNNVLLPDNMKNKRYVIRAIERHGTELKRRSISADSNIIVGIATEKLILRQRIAKRSEQLFAQGVVEEARMLGEMYGWNHESMTGNIYLITCSYLLGKINFETAIERFESLDWNLAKRQMTWFRRNPYIVWRCREEVASHVEARLAG